jgi:predicted RNA binding protein YcfA (HicA-like mRNA interferase family)
VKRTALLNLLARRGCHLFREGSRHTLFWNPANRRITTVPRHREIDDDLARKICRDLGVPFRD